MRWLWFLPALVVLLYTIPSLYHTVGWQKDTALGKPKTVFVGFGTVVVAWGPGKWAKPGSWSMGSFVDDGFTIWHFKSIGATWLTPRFLGDQLYVPLWLIAIILALPPAIIEYRRRSRPVPGCCKECGYDRTGLATEVKCPECGNGS